MSLSKKQQQFSTAMAILELYANYHGYSFTDGNAYMQEGSNDNRSNKSTHRHRLARDKNIFNGAVYLRGEEAKKAHNFIHDFWDMLGGAKRIENDLNHYSFEHNGIL